MVLEIIFSMRYLHYFSNKVILATSTWGVSKLQTLVPDSLLILSSARAVTDYIYFDISKASLSRISHCARCHMDNNKIINNFNTLVEHEPADFLSIE